MENDANITDGCDSVPNASIDSAQEEADVEVGDGGGEKSSGSKIDKGDAVLMAAVAVCFDIVNGGVNLIPFIGQVLSVFVSMVAYLTFWMWFHGKGISFTRDPKKLVRFFGSGIIEAIPILNVLPAVTLGVVLTISLEWAGGVPGIPTKKKA